MNDRTSNAALLSIIMLVMTAVIFMPGTTGSNEYTDLYNVTSSPVPVGLEYYPLVVFGDNRPSWTHYIEYSEEFYTVLNDMYLLNPIAVIGTGDHVGEGRPTQYEKLYSLLVNLSNIWLVPGNHDLKWSGSSETWNSMIGPQNYVVNRIPNWSIIFINPLTDNTSLFNETVHLLFAQAANPNIILVIHYPIHPWVDHNIDYVPNGSLKEKILLELIEEYHVKLVLQGHWHGYAEKTVNGTKYLIIGNSGAPLYNEPSSTDADIIITKQYGYAALILYENGSYTVTPISSLRGDLKVYKISNNTAIIVNTRNTLDNKPATLPFRIQLSLGGENYTVIMLVEKSKAQAIVLENTSNQTLTVSHTPGIRQIEIYNSETLKSISFKESLLGNETAQILLQEYLKTNETTIIPENATSNQTNITTAATNTSGNITVQAYQEKSTIEQPPSITGHALEAEIKNPKTSTHIETNEHDVSSLIKRPETILSIIVIVVALLIKLMYSRH